MRFPWSKPKWEPRADDGYDWSMMRTVEGAKGGILNVGPEDERPKPKGDDWTRCHNCGAQGWDADWGGPHRCIPCKGVGWVRPTEPTKDVQDT